ncbi:coiled-coil domain-containing protein 138 isoform X3 [Ascaphus truei]|uniref:coiled-coil domain-containing protein 138 isoform X3 n=1 Tax=Ascaphus truei TaxID=8439 RepID=UPI003F59D01C
MMEKRPHRFRAANQDQTWTTSRSRKSPELMERLDSYVADSRIPISPTSPAMHAYSERKFYNKALQDLLKMVQNAKCADNINDNCYDSSHIEVADDLDELAEYPMQDSSTRLFTETDVTLPSDLVANTCTEPSMEASFAVELNTRRTGTRVLKDQNTLPSGVKEIYDELFGIYYKLQQERMSQQECSLQLKKREQRLQEKDEILFKNQATLSKIKGVEQIVHAKFRIMKEQHDAEVKQLSDALEEKTKENRRLKSSFDTLKELNDTLKKQLNEVSEQNKKLETQARKVQARLENLQRKHAFLTVQKRKDISQATHDTKPHKIEKTSASVKPKVSINVQAYELLTVLMDWISDLQINKLKSEENGSKDNLLCIHTLPTNYVQEKCAKVRNYACICRRRLQSPAFSMKERPSSRKDHSSVLLLFLPVVVEQFQWMPLVNPKLHMSLIKFTFWSLRQLESGTQSTMTSTLRRLGEEIFKGAVYRSTQEGPFENTTENKPKSAAFFRSNHLPLRFLSTLIVLKTVTQADYLAQALDSLCMDLQIDEGKALFLEYQAVTIILNLLRLSNRGLLSSILDILLQLSTESRFLQPFLDSCSNESFFRTCAALLRDVKVDVQILEKLSIILQKLSKINNCHAAIFFRSNKKLFELFTIPLVIQEMQRKANPDHAFLVINLNSILFHLGLTKSNSRSSGVNTNH